MLVPPELSNKENLSKIETSKQVELADLSDLNEIISGSPDIPDLFERIDALSLEDFKKIILSQCQKDPAVFSFIGYYGRYIENKELRQALMQFWEEGRDSREQSKISPLLEDHLELLSGLRKNNYEQSHFEFGPTARIFLSSIKVIQASFGCLGCNWCCFDAFPKKEYEEHMPLEQLEYLAKYNSEFSPNRMLYLASDLQYHPNFLKILEIFSQANNQAKNITTRCTPKILEDIVPMVSFTKNNSRLSCVSTQKNLIIKILQKIKENLRSLYPNQSQLAECEKNIEAKIAKIKNIDVNKTSYFVLYFHPENNKIIEDEVASQLPLGRNFDDTSVHTRGLGSANGMVLSPLFIGNFIGRVRCSVNHPQANIFSPFEYLAQIVEDDEFEAIWDSSIRELPHKASERLVKNKIEQLIERVHYYIGKLDEDREWIDDEYEQSIENIKEWITIPKSFFIGKPLETILKYVIVPYQYLKEKPFNDEGVLEVFDSTENFLKIKYQYNQLTKQYLVTDLILPVDV